EADAGRLGDTLRSNLGNERVFTDVIDIDMGANWRRVVDHTLRDSVAVLLVIGPKWTLTEPIAYEAGLALGYGVELIPIFVRGATAETLKRQLRSELWPLGELTGWSLEHSRWQLQVGPLIKMLERMLADPTRARFIVHPPNPLAVLETPINRKNLRSMLVHAADLAECLDDASVLAEAQRQAQVVDFLDSDKKRIDDQSVGGLVLVLKDARYRLMVEQIGRDVLQHSTGRRAAQFLHDVDLEQEILND